LIWELRSNLIWLFQYSIMLHDLVEIVRDYLIESITTYYDTGEIHEEYMKIACKIHGAYYVWYLMVLRNVL
jgi:hypothetical protein